MTPEQFRAAREALGWDRVALARRLGYRSETSVWHIESGVQRPRPQDAAWLARAAAFVQAHPRPDPPG